MTAQRYITTERLDIYKKNLKVKPSQVMAAYHWNKALAGALLPAMQCLEVTLRNALNTAIQSFPPAGAKGLWDTNANWVTSLPKYMGIPVLIRLNVTSEPGRQEIARMRQAIKWTDGVTGSWREHCQKKTR